MKTTPIEAAIGLKRTKAGRDDKDLAYLMQQDTARQLGTVLVVAAAFALVYGLMLKNDLSWTQSSQMALRRQVIRERQALFRSKMEANSQSQQAESKLVKILSILQDHLERDSEDQQALIDFQMSFGNTIKKHKRYLKRELKLLGGNTKVHNYLEKQLDKAIEEFYWHVTQQVRLSGENILKEGKEADARVTVLTQGVLDELEAESKEAARASHSEEQLELKDAAWKSMADNFKKHSKYAHGASQDQKDVEEMIEHFKENIADMPDPPSLSKADFDEAQKLKKVLSRQFDSMRHDKMWEQKMWRLNTANVQRPRNEEAIREKMISMMKKAKFVPSGQTATHVDYSMDTMLLFDEFVDMAMMKDALPQLEGELKDWEKDKVSDNVMMLEIEKAVEKGEVNPVMLHEGETSKEQAEMLEMGTKDHEEDPKALPPKPIPEEDEVKASESCGDLCCEGCAKVISALGVPRDVCKTCAARPDCLCKPGAPDFDKSP